MRRRKNLWILLHLRFLRGSENFLLGVFGLKAKPSGLVWRLKAKASGLIWRDFGIGHALLFALVRSRIPGRLAITWAGDGSGLLLMQSRILFPSGLELELGQPLEADLSVKTFTRHAVFRTVASFRPPRNSSSRASTVTETAAACARLFFSQV